MPTSVVNFSAPIGGTVLPSDFAPSLLFAFLYALLVPVLVYRMFSRRSRTLLLILSGILTIERIVFYALRAFQAHTHSKRNSHGLVNYMQASYGLSYVGIANDSVDYIRCLLVNPTFGSDNYQDSPAGRTKGGVCEPPPPHTPDQPQLRYYLRRLTDAMHCTFLTSIILAIVADNSYTDAFSNQAKADRTSRLRYASAGMALPMCCVIMVLLVGSLFKYPARSVSRRSVAIAGLIVVLMAVIAIYRLAIIRIKTTSLAKLNQLDTLDGKAEFYVFHVLPEWTALCILYTVNICKTFSTGFAGDWRYTDKKKQAEEEEMTTRGENGSNDEERGSNVEGDRIKLLEQQHLEYARVQAVQLQATA